MLHIKIAWTMVCSINCMCQIFMGGINRVTFISNQLRIWEIMRGIRTCRYPWNAGVLSCWYPCMRVSVHAGIRARGYPYMPVSLLRGSVHAGIRPCGYPIMRVSNHAGIRACGFCACGYSILLQTIHKLNDIFL